jgi:hypothetical protein
VLPRLAYLTLCRSVQLLVLLARGDAAKDLEILVPRHQLTVLHRQTPRPRLEPADRAMLAATSRLLPRARWSCFIVTPQTLLRWHRRMIAGAWIYPHPGHGRPPLDEHLQQLIVRLATENPRWGYQRIWESCCTSAFGCRQPRSVRRWSATGLAPRQGARPPPGECSCTSRPPESSPATSSSWTKSFGSTWRITTSTVRIARSDWSRQILPLASGSSLRITEPAYNGMTCSAVSCTSTDELHERIYAPYGPAG